MLDFNQIVASHIYDNVALVLLSRDEQGEVWVHFAVEQRVLKGKLQPLLSTFGGAIDKKADGSKENPIEALLREVEEESLGLISPLLKEADLSNPEKTSNLLPSNLKSKEHINFIKLQVISFYPLRKQK